MTGWPDPVKDTFLRSQFDAQDRHYRQVYPDAAYDVILAGHQPAGRLYVATGARDVRIVDIALLPVHRGHGIGTAILQTVIARATAGGRSVSIHVERDNRAQHLYSRLGFEPIESHGVYVLMVRALS